MRRWNAETAQLAVQLRHDLREGWRSNVVTKELMSSRGRPTLKEYLPDTARKFFLKNGKNV